MFVILTCFGKCEPFAGLTQQIPVAMLPVLGKPILEHLIEQCVDVGATRIHVALLEHPRPVRHLLGNGERWGAPISAWNFRNPCSYDIVLKRLAGDHRGSVLLIPAETLIDLDFEALIAFHERGAQQLTRVMAREIPKELKPGSWEENCPEPVSDEGVRDTSIVLTDFPTETHGTFDTFTSDGDWLRVETPTDLLHANRGSLYGRFRHLTRPGVAKPEIGWLGHHCRIDHPVSIEPPVFIGNHVYISSGVRIGGGSAIGNCVIIDEQAKIESSVIMDDTYVGSYTDVLEKIVGGNFVMNAKTGLGMKVTDPIIVSDLRERTVRLAARRATDKALAALMLLLTCPIWILKGLLRILRGKTFIDTKLCIIAHPGDDRSAALTSHRVNLLVFNDSNPFVSRLPGLLDVVAGRLSLVGIRPLQEAEMPMPAEDWAMLRFDAPAGLFTLLDALGLHDLEEDEKTVIENYYASTRNLSGDLKIWFKAMLNLVLSR
jgi:NDP-sugar pyrophosphorylase family protein